jgi:hypothetical protein
MRWSQEFGRPPPVQTNFIGPVKKPVAVHSCVPVPTEFLATEPEELALETGRIFSFLEVRYVTPAAKITQEVYRLQS